ncbi:C-type mannose receptor 2 [Bagarius yarrelli]|uniref:C-type mannose receptor 2 n=1 Tax=Bagarius yarrelli TaxID=175774 RepID=A0A556TH22_BAGYA|nr:C-type mannose receptor 2 [Bagarius yarrelli]
MKSAQFFFFLAALTGATCLIRRKHVLVSINSSWFNAQTHCRQNYVDLSTLDSEEELSKFKLDVRNNVVRSWIGLNKRPDQMDFSQWSDGTVFKFALWQSGKPDNKATEHCASAYNAQLNDYGCENLIPFVCYTWEPTLIFVQDLKTWYEALVHCRTWYTELISLSTERDFLLVNAKFTVLQSVSVWTGLNFLDGSWFWSNNETVMNPNSLPSCPIKPFHCGAKVGGTILENADCMKKMSFICYQF